VFVRTYLVNVLRSFDDDWKNAEKYVGSMFDWDRYSLQVFFFRDCLLSLSEYIEQYSISSRKASCSFRSSRSLHSCVHFDYVLCLIRIDACGIRIGSLTDDILRFSYRLWHSMVDIDFPLVFFWLVSDKFLIVENIETVRESNKVAHHTNNRWVNYSLQVRYWSWCKRLADYNQVESIISDNWTNIYQ
jgi:hypothetical protein